MYLEMAGSIFLFIYFFLLYETLEDPFEFHLNDLLPKAPPPQKQVVLVGGGKTDALWGSLPASTSAEAQELHTKESGASDVDVTPLIEVAARLLWYCEGGAISGSQGMGNATMGLSSLAWGGPHDHQESMQAALEGAPTSVSVLRLRAEGDASLWSPESTINARKTFRETFLGRLRCLMSLPTDHVASGSREALLKRMASASSLARTAGGKSLKRKCTCCFRV